VKIAKITAKSRQCIIAANLINFMVSNSRKMYILGKMRTTMTPRSQILPVSNKAHGLWQQRQRKGNIFVLNSHNKLQIMLIKNKVFLRHFGKITAFTAFDENHGFRDFRDYLYCP